MIVVAWWDIWIDLNDLSHQEMERFFQQTVLNFTENTEKRTPSTCEVMVMEDTLRQYNGKCYVLSRHENTAVTSFISISKEKMFLDKHKKRWHHIATVACRPSGEILDPYFEETLMEWYHQWNDVVRAEISHQPI